MSEPLNQMEARIEHRKMVDFSYRSKSTIQPMLHSHSFYELYYFHSGRCNYLIGDKIFILSPGDLIIMYGMTLHCPKVDASVPYIRSIVHFEPNAIKPFLSSPYAINVLEPFEELKNHRIALRGEHREEAERILEQMYIQQQQQSRIGDNRMRLAFVDLLYLVYEQCLLPLRQNEQVSGSERGNDKEKAVQEVITYLDQHYADDLSLEVLQHHMHISKSYLAKIFKEITGITIFDFIYRKRINQAKILFYLEPQLSVTEVSFRVGFKHLAHFSRLFKQHIGSTPEQYRKRVTLSS